jgi:hypothetical protein
VVSENSYQKYNTSPAAARIEAQRIEQTFFEPCYVMGADLEEEFS